MKIEEEDKIKPMIEAHERKVYKGLHRFYFTKRGAASSFVYALMGLHCSCVPRSPADSFGEACKWHEDDARAKLRFKRIQRWVMRHYKDTQEKEFLKRRKTIGYGFKGKVLDNLNS